MSKSLDFLRSIFLYDFDLDSASKIIKVEGAECGHACMLIWTQSSEQKKDKVATLHKVFSEEVCFELSNKGSKSGRKEDGV